MGGHGEADALEIAAASILRLRGGAALEPAETFTAKAQHVLKADIAEREIANFADCVGRQDILSRNSGRSQRNFCAAAFIMFSMMNAVSGPPQPR